MASEGDRGADAKRGYQLRVGPASALAVSIVMYPQQSVLSLLRYGPTRRRCPGPSAPIDGTLRPAARFAARSLAASPAAFPDCSAPIPPLADVSVAEQADRLRDLPPDLLAGELHGTGSSFAYPPQWAPAAHQPRRWLASMADASLDAWAALQPQWQAAMPSLDREARRAGTAMVRGGLDALLNSLNPDISYADGVLAISGPDDRLVALGQRRLVLIPMISIPGDFTASFEQPDVCFVGYSIRPPSPGTHARAGGSLALILGPARAAALQALHQPLTVGQVAAAIQCAPTTATYHLQQLVAAGLVARERQGTTVRISRTTRGDELIDLLAD